MGTIKPRSVGREHSKLRNSLSVIGEGSSQTSGHSRESTGTVKGKGTEEVNGHEEGGDVEEDDDDASTERGSDKDEEAPVDEDEEGSPDDDRTINFKKENSLDDLGTDGPTSASSSPGGSKQSSYTSTSPFPPWS